MGMPEERWPAIIHSWIPPGRRKRGRPRRSWRDGGITEAMEKRWMGKKTPRTGYFEEEDWEGGGQPYEPIYIYIIRSTPILGGEVKLETHVVAF
jgi:hypothetical protein